MIKLIWIILKRDVLDDQKFHVKDKDEKQTADEKHISKLAGDVKHDEKKEGVSSRESLNLISTRKERS